MPLHPRQVTNLVKDNFGKVWPVYLSEFTRLLIQLRDHFDGDLELVIIMAVVAERTRPENWTPELHTYRQLTEQPYEGHKQIPINLQSVADYSGIPRETVRRKVKLLERRGWVTRDVNGLLAVGLSAAKDLEEATSQSVGYLETLFRVFEEVRELDAAHSANS